MKGSDDASSRHKIINVLDRNPNEDPDKYDEEEKAKQGINSKSYKLLENWGHDKLRN